MNKALIWIVIIGVLGGFGYYAWNSSRTPEPVPEERSTAEEPKEAPVPAAPEAPPIRYPIESKSAAASLPALDESDGPVGDALARLFGMSSLPSFFYPDKMIRRFVATVDNLPRERVSSSLMPVKPVPGAFNVTGAEGYQTISAENSQRYGRYVDAMQSVDVKELVDFYVRFYPLFQQAYRELGYPKGYFNDRLVEALDDLLAAPDVPAPIRLVRPKVLYQFADRKLESLSAGQKIMVRMGSANAEKVKSKLRAIREEVVKRAPNM